MKITVAFLSLLSALPSRVHGIADVVGEILYVHVELSSFTKPDDQHMQEYVMDAFYDSEYMVPSFEYMEIADSCVLSTQGSDGVIVQNFTHSEYSHYEERLWALRVEGPSVVLTLRCSDPNDVGMTRFFIDSYAVLNESPASSVCGTDDKINVICALSDEELDEDIYVTSKAVARILINGEGACTGWLVGVSSAGNSLLMTTKHCIHSNHDVINSSFEFMAEENVCEGVRFPPLEQADVYGGKTLVKANSDLDYSVVELEPNTDGEHAHENYGYFLLEDRLPVVDERIYIPQHAGGRKKEIGFLDTMSTGGYCKVLSTRQAGCSHSSGEVDMGYTCDTEVGSSGSPIVLYGSNTVIGMHHCTGECYNDNWGVMMKHIVADLNILSTVFPSKNTIATSVPTETYSTIPTVLQSTISTVTSSTIPCDHLFMMRLHGDGNGFETHYELVDDHLGAHVLNGHSAGAFSIIEEILCLSEGHKYTFVITDHDGICCASGNGTYELLLNGEILNVGGEFHEYEIVIFRL